MKLSTKEDDEEVQEEEQQQQQPIFGDRPIKTRCPNCLSVTVSDMVLKAEYSTIVLSALVFLVLPNILNVIAMMFAFMVASVKKHRCSICQFQLGTDGKFMICLKDQVYSFNVGRSGIILTKKILVSIGLTIAVLIAIFTLWAMNPRRNLQFVDTKWQSFAKQCGMQASSLTLEHDICQQKYQMKSFMNWTGYVMKVQDNRESYSRFYLSDILIYLKVFPQIKDNQPQILLQFDRLSTLIEQKKIQQLHHGDEIVFNATFNRFMNEGSTVMLFASQFQQTGHQRFVEYIVPTQQNNLKKLRKHV